MPRSIPRRRRVSSSRSSLPGRRTARTIAFASKRSGSFDLYAMSADGSGTRRLTSTKEDDGHPTWSPDGERIAFARGAPEPALRHGRRRLRRAPRDGRGGRGEPSRRGRPTAAGSPTRGESPGSSIRELWLVRPDGSQRASADEARRRRSGAGVVSGRQAASPSPRTRRARASTSTRSASTASSVRAHDVARRLVRAGLVARRQDDRLRGGRGDLPDRRGER